MVSTYLKDSAKPFKYYDYSEITLFQESVEKGGHKPNYLVLYDDLELWNLFTFQLDNLENSVRNFTSLSITLKQIDKKLLNWIHTMSNNASAKSIHLNTNHATLFKKDLKVCMN